MIESSPLLPRIQLLQYSALALPLAFCGIPLYLHAPDFYATQLGVPLALLGGILMAVRSFDAIQDPFIGWFSDRFSQHRLSLTVISVGLLGIGFFALFHPWKGIPIAVWFTLTLVITTTSYSVLTINLMALGSVWRQGQDAQSRIVSWRETGTLLGVILASALPLFLQRYVSQSESYTPYTFIMMALLLIGGMSFCYWMKHSFSAESSPATQAFIPIRRLIGMHRAFFSIYFISVLASAIPAVLVLFFIRDVLQAEAWSGAFLLLYFVSGIVAMPLWSFLGTRYGLTKSWFLSILVAVFSFVWAYAVEGGDILSYSIICVLSGTALGAELTIPAAILALRIQSRGQESQSAVQFSILAFSSKAALAMAAGIMLPLLGYLGYQPGQTNSPDALDALRVSYTLIPCLMKMAAGLVLLYRAPYQPRQGDQYENHLQRRPAHGDHGNA